MNLFDIYDDRAQERGDAPAIHYVTQTGTTVLSWVDLISRAQSTARLLTAEGVRPGSRCAITLADRPATVPALLGIWLSGGVAVLLDPQWGTVTTANVLRHSGARFHLTVGWEPTVTDLGGGHGNPPLPDGVALLAYTSGSTGAPKGIPLHHRRLISALISGCAVIEAYRDAPVERFASSMRLSGFGVLVLHFLMNAVSGTEVYVLPRLDITTARAYWSWIGDNHIDATVLVPPLFELLLRASRKAPEQRAPLYINSSGPLADHSHTRFQETFDARILNCYGQTEASFAVTFGDTTARGDKPTQSIGRPFNLQARLTTPYGVVIGLGEGELELRGPTVSDGYYDNPTANREAFVDGWLRTGDLARRDASGRYWIVGRRKDAVMKGGVTVYLTEVEEASLPYPGVAEALAVRLELDGGSEDIGLLIRPDAGAQVDTRRLQQELSRTLGSGRAPRRILQVSDPLPRLGQNKPDRRAARALWDGLTATPEANVVAAP